MVDKDLKLQLDDSTLEDSGNGDSKLEENGNEVEKKEAKSKLEDQKMVVENGISEDDDAKDDGDGASEEDDGAKDEDDGAKDEDDTKEEEDAKDDDAKDEDEAMDESAEDNHSEEETDEEENSADVSEESIKEPKADTAADGKRVRKQVDRLVFDKDTPSKKTVDTAHGSGVCLGEIEYISHMITKTKPEDLKILHRIIFKSVGKTSDVKKKIRSFNGFSFKKGGPEYQQFCGRIDRLFSSQLKLALGVLGLMKSGSKQECCERIASFLVHPTDENKKVTKKKSRSKPSKKSKSAKKTPAKKTPAKKTPAKKPKKQSSSDEESDGDSDVEETENGAVESSEEEEEEKEAPAKKSSTRTPAKKPAVKTPAKKSTAKKAKQPADDSEQQSSGGEKSESEEREDEKMETSDEEINDTPAKKTSKKTPAKKPSAKKPTKSPGRTKTPVAKAATNGRKRIRVEDSDSDEEPIIKKAKPEKPSNDVILKFLSSYIKTIDLEEVTMKQIYQRVYDNYPDFDLSDRKDFIKTTVKTLIA